MNRIWWVPETVFIVVAVGVLAAGCARGADRVAPTSTVTDAPAEPSATPSATPVRPLTEATVAISPPSGPPGTEVQVTAAGFPPDTEIELGAGPKDSEYDVLKTSRTDPEGALITSLVIPMSADPEEDWVVVASTPDGGRSSVSNLFQVVAPQVDPEVSISPLSGPPGTEVQLAAEGFPPGTTVEIGVGREDSEYDVVRTRQTMDDGSLRADAVIPA